MNEDYELLIIGDLEHIVIDHGNDEFTSMPKSVWDAQQAAQAEPVLSPTPLAEEPVDPAL